jgi:hypothetical protein
MPCLSATAITSDVSARLTSASASAQIFPIAPRMAYADRQAMGRCYGRQPLRGVVAPGDWPDCRLITGHTSARTLGYTAAYSAGIVLLVWAEVLIFTIPHLAQEAQMAKLGFILSVAGISTQFLPPALDLLGITVK